MFHFLPNDFASSSFYLFCPLNFWWFSWYTEPLCCFSGFVFWLSPLSVPLKTPWRSFRKSFIVFTAMPLSSRCNPQLSALHAVQQNRCLGFLFHDKSYLSSLSWLSICVSGKCCAVYSTGTHFDVSWCLCFLHQQSCGKCMCHLLTNTFDAITDSIEMTHG